MLLHFLLVNTLSGETEIPGYIDVAELASWTRWKVPDDAPMGGPSPHRTLRGKFLISLNTKGGMTHWTDESFDSVSARILEARGQKDRAEIHAAANAAEKARELQTKKSPMAVS
jgi:hypothetical protein